MRDTVLIGIFVGIVMLDQKSSELGWVDFASDRSVLQPVDFVVAFKNFGKEFVEGCRFAIAKMKDVNFLLLESSYFVIVLSLPDHPAVTLGRIWPHSPCLLLALVKIAVDSLKIIIVFLWVRRLPIHETGRSGDVQKTRHFLSLFCRKKAINPRSLDSA